MVSFSEYIKKEMNLKLPKGTISSAWFSRNCLPMVVACSCCGTTMASPSAWIDEEGNTYCADCADIAEG